MILYMNIVILRCLVAVAELVLSFVLVYIHTWGQRVLSRVRAIDCCEKIEAKNVQKILQSPITR